MKFSNISIVGILYTSIVLGFGIVQAVMHIDDDLFTYISKLIFYIPLLLLTIFLIKKNKKENTPIIYSVFFIVIPLMVLGYYTYKYVQTLLM